jgi:hypothetical protein
MGLVSVHCTDLLQRTAETFKTRYLGRPLTHMRKFYAEMPV